MNIGIMSMQRIVNYGSFLQAYGLMRVLEGMGHSVTFVDYEVEKALVEEERTSTVQKYLKKFGNICRMILPEYRRYREQQICLNRSFGEFVQAYCSEFLPLLGVKESPNYRPELDMLIIGSDEVFNCTQKGETVGFSRELFGKDHRANALVSYAASFGSTTMEKIERFGIGDEIAGLLQGFYAVSVRDTNSAQIIQKLCGRIPFKHIDPVLLYDFSEVDSISIDIKEYIVVYAYADRITDEEAKAIQTFAKKKNKKILTLGFYQPFCDEYVLAKPLEVLAYIKHADYVITDTFHGTIFSIKYQTPFATLVRESNQQKLMDLLLTFDVQDRQIKGIGQLENVLEKTMNAEMICRRIKEEQVSAYRYLEMILGDCHE